MTRIVRPRSVRGRLLLLVLSALFVALAAATVGFNVLFVRTTQHDADSFLRRQADSERSLVRVKGRRLEVIEATDDALGDSRVWIFRGQHPIEAPATRAETTAAARSLARGPSRYVTVANTDERLYSLPIVDGGRRVGTVVTGLSLGPYEQTQRSALIASLAFAATLLAAVGVAVWWILRSALQPVAVMTQQAAEWSERDLDRRFSLGEPHDELTTLAATLDQLLGRIAASLRRERRLSAELSHELRTPLARLIAEAELALRRTRTDAEYRDALEVVLANARQLTRIVETLLAAAQQEARRTGVADAGDVARATAEACRPLAEQRGLAVAVEDTTRRARVGVDLDLAERILHPVVENACRYGTSRVSVSVARSDGVVAFTIDDDGPGIVDAERDAIFEPAARGAVGRRTGDGAGLGLALARRLARSVKGDVTAVAASGGGRFVVRLPAA
jgi:signal transduction histidine kinase